MTREPTIRAVRFGRCVVDLRRRLLWRDGRPVALTAKTFDVLAFLLERPNRVVEKEEFFTHVWPGTSVLEASLVRQISLLRKALGQRPDHHEYIVTIPGRGYELVAVPEPLATLPDDIGAQTGSAVTAPAAAGHDPIVASRDEARHGRSGTVLNGFLGIGLIVAVVVVGTRWWTSTHVNTPRTLSRVTFESGSPREPSWSPDGKWIAFTSDASGNPDIWIQKISEATPTQLTFDPARDGQPTWSPDGKFIAFRSERNGGGIYRISVDGGEERRLSTFGFNPKWSPTGERILLSGSTVRTGAREAYVVDPAGDVARQIGAEVIESFTDGSTSLGWLNSVEVNWHPDGARISVWGRSETGDWSFVTVPVLGGRPSVSAIPRQTRERLERERLSLGRFWWARSGRYLYFEGEAAGTRNIWRISVDPSNLAWQEGPDRLTTGTSEETDIALSNDGSRLVFAAGTPRTRVWAFRVDPQTGRMVGPGQPVTSGNAGEVDIDSSPDGRKLAYRTTRGGKSEVREFDTSSRQERLLLASMDWRPTTPRWSADGRRLAYTRADSAATAIESPVTVLSIDGRAEQLVKLPGGAYLVPTHWSADGRALLGSCRLKPSDSMSVCSITIGDEGGSPSDLRVIAQDPSLNLWVPRFSPDQRWVAFVAVDVKDARTSRVFVAPSNGGDWTPVTNGQSFDDKPRWSPDGRTIYFVSSQDGFLNLWARRFDARTGNPDGASVRVTSFSGPEQLLPSSISRIEFAVTGDRLFVPLTEKTTNLWMLDQVDR